MAETRIADYNDTAGNFRKKLKGVDGLQEGDPEKAAASIVELANQEHLPLRIPMGKTALATMGLKVEELKQSLEDGRQRAERLVF